MAVVEVMEYTSLAPHKPVRRRLALGERGQKVTRLISPGRSSPRPVVGPANLARPELWEGCGQDLLAQAGGPDSTVEATN